MVMVVVMMVVVVVVMIMIVVMMVVVVMVVMVVVLVRIGVKFLGSHLGLRHLGELEDVVHRLVLENRRPELGQQLRIVAVIVVDLPLLARKLLHPIEQRAAHLLVGDL